MFGAAMAENLTLLLMVVAQLVYSVYGSSQESWSGFFTKAFKSLSDFIRLLLVPAIMFGLDIWYYILLINMMVRLKDPEIAVDAFPICLDLFTMMIMGLSAAVSARVSIKIGAERPRDAKSSVVVAVVTSKLFGIFFTAAVFGTISQFPKLFTNDKELIKNASRLGYFLTITNFLNNVQVVLGGVPVGAGMQTTVALFNTLCFYIFDLPFSALLGFKFRLGVEGIWLGMLAGYLLQTIFLSISIYIFKANWNEEAMHDVEQIQYHAIPVPPNDGEAAVETGLKIKKLGKFMYHKINSGDGLKNNIGDGLRDPGLLIIV